MINANFNTPLINKGSTLLRLKKYDEANKCFDLVMKQQPRNLLVLLGKGVSLYESRKFEDALRLFS